MWLVVGVELPNCDVCGAEGAAFITYDLLALTCRLTEQRTDLDSVKGPGDKDGCATCVEAFAQVPPDTDMIGAMAVMWRTDDTFSRAMRERVFADAVAEAERMIRDGTAGLFQPRPR